MWEYRTLDAARHASERRYGRRLLVGVSALVLALACLSPIPASAQAITQGGGNGGGGAGGGLGGAGGLVGGGGGGGGTSTGAAGNGGNAGNAGSNGVDAGGLGGIGGQSVDPYDGGGGGGGGGGTTLGHNGGGGGDGGHTNVDSTSGPVVLSGNLAGGNGNNGQGGTITGAAGGSGGGGGGYLLTGTGTALTTAGHDIGGGNGGDSGSGGGGGAGLVLENSGTVTVNDGGGGGTSTITGGNGGDDGGSGAGDGGAGLFLHNGGALDNQTGTINGGNGGNGGNSGGNGGAGVLSNKGSISNAGTINGGTGGTSSFFDGGDGGAGIMVWGGGITNTGTINGGAAGSVSGGINNGKGGAGIFFRDNETATLINSGTISGGAGLLNADGGAGIVGATTGGITVINEKNIIGGTNGDGSWANAITFAGDNNRLELHDGYSFTGNVVAGSGAGNVLAFGGAGNLSFDVSKITPVATLGATDEFVGFDGLEKTGAGTWTLTGIGPFSNTMTVDAGTLLVDAWLGSASATVNNGATLGGHGTLSNVTVNSGGTLAPGNSIGTINVWNLTYNAGAIHEVELADTGNTAGTDNDLTLATGVVTIDNGAILHVTPENGTDNGKTYTPGLTYTVITSTSGAPIGVTGTFGTVTDDYLYLDFTDSYDSHNVYLTSAFVVPTFCLSGFTVNQCATAGGVQSTGAGTLFNAIANLTDPAVAGAAFDALSGEIHASGKTALIEGSHYVSDAMNEHLRAGSAAPGDQDAPALAYAATPGTPAGSAIGNALLPTAAERFAAWGTAFGAWNHTDGDGNAAAFDRTTGGLIAGIDGLVTDTARLGVVATYTHSSFDADARASTGDADVYHLGAYGGTAIGALGLRGGAAYGWGRIETTRAVAFPGFTDSLTADYGAGLFQAFGEISYRLDTPAAAIEPFVNLTHVSLHTDGYTEKGGAAALTSEAETTNTTFATLGIRASTAFTLNGLAATARGLIGWRHAFGDTAPTATHALAGGGAFTVAGASIARDTAVIEAGLNFTLARNATLDLSYNGEFGSGTFENGARAILSVKF